MSIVASCQCGREFRVSSAHAGKQGKCPSCGVVVTIPHAAEPPMMAAPEIQAQPDPAEVWPPMPVATVRKMPAPPAFDIPEPVMIAPPRARSAGRGKIWAAVAVGVLLLGGGAFAGFQMGWFGKADASANKPAGPAAPNTPGSALLLTIASPDPSAVPVQTTNAIELKTKFVPGLYDLTESTTSRSSVQMSAQGQSMSIGNKDKTTIGGDVRVGAPDSAGEQQVTFTCRSIKMTTDSESPGRKNESMSYDSEASGAQSGMLAEIMSGMIGWQGIVWCRDGKYVRADGVVQLMQRIRNSAPPGADPFLRKFEPMMADFLKEMLTQHYGEALPKTPVKPGDRWTAQIKVKAVPMLGPMEVNCECMLHRIERGKNGADVAVVGFSCNTRISNRDMNLSEMLPGAPPAHIEYMNITQAGVFYFDTGIGLSTRVGMSSNVTGSMTMSGGPGGEKLQMSLNAEQEANNFLSRNTGGPRPPPVQPVINRSYGSEVKTAEPLPPMKMEEPIEQKQVDREAEPLPFGAVPDEAVQRATPSARPKVPVRESPRR